MQEQKLLLSSGKSLYYYEWVLVSTIRTKVCTEELYTLRMCGTLSAMAT
jgi:hypothetical protein